MHSRYFAGRVDDPVSFRMFRRQGKITLSYALVKGPLLSFEAIFPVNTLEPAILSSARLRPVSTGMSRRMVKAGVREADEKSCRFLITVRSNPRPKP